MWEIPFYLIFAPIFTIVITMMFARANIPLAAPPTVFAVLSFPVIIFIANDYNVGSGAIFGWAAIFSVISLITLISLNMIKLKKSIEVE